MAIETPRSVQDCAADIARWPLEAFASRARARLGWTHPHSLRVLTEYQKFLALVMAHPGRSYGMGGDVDEIWHEHILDTLNYAEMCDRIAGTFIHHVPAAGSSDAEIQAGYRLTLSDLERHFGGPDLSVWPVKTDIDGVANCGGRCCKDITAVSQALT